MSVSASAGTIYKCKNAEGAMLYQEKPCEKEVQAISSWASTSGVEIEDDSPANESKTLVIGQGNGGHYFIDVPAGLTIAILAIMAARRIAAHAHQPRGFEGPIQELAQNSLAEDLPQLREMALNCRR